MERIGRGSRGGPMNHVPLLPGANSPQLLARVLESVARGVRTTRGLQEAVGVGVHTVRAYVHAGAWLGLVDATDPVELSPLGLEFVYAGSRRPVVYARAVWSNPLAAELLVASDGRLPEVAQVERAIARAETGLADATLRRRASAVRGLVAPVVGRPRPLPRDQDELQLALPLSHAPALEVAPAALRTAGEHDPELYRYVLGCLLDHGELSVGHVRALVDRAGVSGGLGGVIELFGSRGDAARVGERFVVTAAAVARRSLADHPSGVALSDPGYRAYLGATERRLVANASRYKLWDHRLFGRSIEGSEVADALTRLIPDRPLAAFPLARPTAEVPAPESGPFLDGWERPALRIALPPSLLQLQGGVAVVNRLLHHARTDAGVRVPDLADRPAVVHGSLVHPGEPLPRTVPDARSLRQRVLMHVPYAAVAAGLLLLHRLSGDRGAVVDEGLGWTVRAGAGERVPLLEWIDGFAASRGWVASRRDGHGLSGRSFVALLGSVGVVTEVGRMVVLSEPLFAQLRSEAEESEIFARLFPLADAIEAQLAVT